MIEWIIPLSIIGLIILGMQIKNYRYPSQIQKEFTKEFNKQWEQIKMTEKRFYCIDEDEYNSYWIADTSKVDKNKEDFYDEKEELYQRYKFEEYLEDNNAVLKGEEVVDLLNEQHETIQRLEAQLSHLEYRFFEYRNKAKGLPKDKVKETLQKRYNHLQKTQQETEKPPRYWQGAIMEIEVIADCLGVELK